MRDSKNMFFLFTSTNPFSGEKREKRDTKRILIDLAMIRSWPGTVRNEGVGRRERARAREGGEGEVVAVLLLAGVETHVMTSLD